MKTILILPGERPGVEILSQSAPLANLPLFGTTLVGRWLEYLAKRGAKEVRVLAVDRAEAVEAEVGDGSRWGIEVEVIRVLRELTVEETLRKYRLEIQSDWQTAPNDIMVADCLPELPKDKLFESYEQFFAVMQKALATGACRGRVGAREIKPGVWMGLRSHIAPGAVIEGPCWIGEDVHIEKDVLVGQNVVLEDRTWVGAGAEVEASYLAPDTHLGVTTSLIDSLGMGNLLVDWRHNSSIVISDAFLLCCLRTPPLRVKVIRLLSRLSEATRPEPSLFPEKQFSWSGPLLR